MLGDIGFDHPGRFGMSFGHGIVLSVLYVIALVGGLICSCAGRKWKTAASQLLVPLLVFVYIVWPASHYDAGNYKGQHLVGKTKIEVERQLNPHHAVYGLQAVDDVETEFASYDGMTIHYSAEGVVVKIESND